MNPVSATTEELRRHFHEGVMLLQRLRDEVRLGLHLGEMDVKEDLTRRFHDLEKRYGDLDHLARELTWESKRRLDDARREYEALRALIAPRPPRP